MKRPTDQKFLLAIVVFLVGVTASQTGFAQGRSCADLFQNDVLFSGEARVARLNLRADEASYAAAIAITDPVRSRMEDPNAFVRMVQDHLVKTFEANVQLMFEQRRDLFDFFVASNNPVHLIELLSATSRIYSVRVDGGDLFHIASQDKNAFFEVANRLSQRRRASH